MISLKPALEQKPQGQFTQVTDYTYPVSHVRPRPLRRLRKDPPMPPIVQFMPTFRHQDWVDTVDRVTAGGVNGFNGRFNALLADLNQLTQVVKAVDDALLVRPPAKTLIETNVTIPAFNAGPPATGGVADVTLGALLPLTSHAFHQVSVRPDAAFLNVQVTWTEVAFVVDTG